MRRIDSTYFRDLAILSIVDLSYNQIDFISGEVFEMSEVTLTSVNISNNQISSLPERVFNQFYQVPGKEVVMDANPVLFASTGAASGSVTNVLTFQEQTVQACTLCLPGTYFVPETGTCQSASAFPRGYTNTDGATQVRICPSAFLLAEDRSACTALACGDVCVTAIGVSLLIPFLVALGKMILASYWLNQVLAKDKVEKEKLLRAEIRQQVLEESSRPFDRTKKRLLNDDMQLQTVYIDWNKINMVKSISYGAYGEIVLGEYCGGRVAIKRLLANRLCAEEVVGFAHEIHIMVSLRHPNIVQFIGVTWSSCHDICAVSEFMERGDLHRVLTRGIT